MAHARIFGDVDHVAGPGCIIKAGCLVSPRDVTINSRHTVSLSKQDVFCFAIDKPGSIDSFFWSSTFGNQKKIPCNHCQYAVIAIVNLLSSSAILVLQSLFGILKESAVHQSDPDQSCEVDGADSSWKSTLPGDNLFSNGRWFQWFCFQALFGRRISSKLNFPFSQEVRHHHR